LNWCKSKRAKSFKKLKSFTPRPERIEEPARRSSAHLHFTLARQAFLPLWSIMGLKIAVTVKPNAKKAQVVELAEKQYRVAVREAAQDGKANRALVDILADHFGVAKSTVKIIRGHSARHKLIEIG
jgi:hypothetical protein